MTGILMMSVGNSYGALPVNTVAPVVSGTASVGSTLSTTNGTWTGAPAPTFTYQWQRNSSNISGATSSTYVLVTDDADTSVRCVVTGTNTLGAASANSNALTIAPLYWVATIDTNWSGAWAHATFASSSGVWAAMCNGGYQGAPRSFLDKNGVISSVGLYPGSDGSVYPQTPSLGTGGNLFSSYIGQPPQYATNTSNGDYFAVGDVILGSNYGCGVAKMNSAGGTVWYRRLSTTSSQANSSPNQIWRDSSGYSWICGRSEYTSSAGFVFRLDDSGNLITSKSLSGVSSGQGVTGVTTDSSNNPVFAMYNAGGSSTPNWSYISKTDPTVSTFTWRKRFYNAQVPSTNGRGPFLYNLYASGSNTLASGWTNTETSTNRQALLVSLNSSGNLSWGWRVTSPDNNARNTEGGSVYVDASGNVWWIWSFYYDAYNSDIMGISKFNSGGSLLFQRALIGPSGGSNRVRPGSVTVVGSTLYITATYNVPNHAPLVFKLPADGSKTGVYLGFTYADFGISHNSDMSIIGVEDSTTVGISSYGAGTSTSPNVNSTYTPARNGYAVIP